MVLRIAYIALALLICLITPLYLMRVVQRRHTPNGDLFVLAAASQTSYGLAAILYFPGVEEAMAQWTGIAQLSLWLSNMCSLIAVYCSLRFFRSMRYAHDPTSPLLGRSLYSVMALMTVAILLANGDVVPNGQPLHSLSWSLILYRLLDILSLGYCTTALVLLWVHQARLTRDGALRTGLILFLGGGGFAVLWLALNLPLMMTLRSDPASLLLNQWYGAALAGEGVCFMLGAIIPLVGMPRSAVGTPVHAMFLYYRLYPLWRDLTAAVPRVILPLSTEERAALWRTAELDVLLYRRVIELLDAWHHLTSVASPNAPVHHDALATLPARAIWHAWACADAARTLALLQQHHINVPVPSHLPKRYVDQVMYLATVAREYVALKRHPDHASSFMTADLPIPVQEAL